MDKPVYTLQNHQECKRYLDTLKDDFFKKFSLTIHCNESLNDYDLIKAISNGAYGDVYLVRNKHNFSYNAMKVVEKRIVVEKQHVKHLLLEKKILQCINFPFVINLKAAFKDNLYLYFILPYIAGGELFTHIHKFGCINDELSKFYASQVTLAVEYLHHCNLIHRDIKPENILISTNGYIKLVDFGFCKVMKKKTWTLCGTPEYIAPEVILAKGYGFQVDWWAVGVLIFEMQAGTPPFYSSNPNRLYEKILSGTYKCPLEMDPDCKKLIKAFLQKDPQKRIGTLKDGVYDIKSHSWFSSICWESILYQRVRAPYIPDCKSESDTGNFPEMDQPRLRTSTSCHYEEEFLEF